MQLFYMPGASSLAVHIALEWAGAIYETVRMNRHSIKEQEYLQLNPLGTVPFLVQDGFALTESVAILAYVADSYPRSELLPTAARSRAEVMRWLGFLNSDVAKAFSPIFAPGQYLKEEVLGERLAETARRHVRDCLARLNAQLEGREWLTGSKSIADAYLFVMLRWALVTKVRLGEFPNLSAFLRRMHLDPGVHAALVDEEGLAPRSSRSLLGNARTLAQLTEKLAGGASVHVEAEVVGTVEYREGEGMLFELRRGIVQIDLSGADTVFSWSDEKCRGAAAIPFQNFARYLSDGSIAILEA